MKAMKAILSLCNEDITKYSKTAKVTTTDGLMEANNNNDKNNNNEIVSKKFHQNNTQRIKNLVFQSKICPG